MAIYTLGVGICELCSVRHNSLLLTLSLTLTLSHPVPLTLSLSLSPSLPLSLALNHMVIRYTESPHNHQRTHNKSARTRQIKRHACIPYLKKFERVGLVGMHQRKHLSVHNTRAGGHPL